MTYDIELICWFFKLTLHVTHNPCASQANQTFFCFLAVDIRMEWLKLNCFFSLISSVFLFFLFLHDCIVVIICSNFRIPVHLSKHCLFSLRMRFRQITFTLSSSIPQIAWPLAVFLYCGLTCSEVLQTGPPHVNSWQGQKPEDKEKTLESGWNSSHI